MRIPSHPLFSARPRLSPIMKLLSSSLFLLLGFTTLSAQSVSVHELERWLQEDDPPTLIDLRSRLDYSRNHLPGALHMPAQSLEQRALPPLGKVVLYGSGLGRYDETTALAAMLGKPGIEPYLLQGGYAAWADGSRPIAGESGLLPERLPVVTYAEAMTTLPPDSVILDTREPAQSKAGTVSPQSSVNDPVPEWADSLGLPLRRTAGGASGQTGISPVGELERSSNQELIVIVDDDPGRADQAARRLRAQGHTRVVVLVGGVESILFQGQYGKTRSSSSTTMEGDLDEIN